MYLFIIIYSGFLTYDQKGRSPSKSTKIIQFSPKFMEIHQIH